MAARGDATLPAPMTYVPDTDKADAAAPMRSRRIAALVGRPVGSRGGRQVAPTRSTQPMIRHWAAAFEDANPVYTDPEAAARSRFGEHRGSAPDAADLDHGDAEDHGDRRAGRLTSRGRGTPPRWPCSTKPGYVGTLATNSDFEILRYLRLGDVVSAESTIEAISEEKQTAARAGTVRDVGHDLYGPRRRGRGPPGVPHPEVQTRSGGIVSASAATTPDVDAPSASVTSCRPWRSTSPPPSSWPGPSPAATSCPCTTTATTPTPRAHPTSS